jgi:hypothetical protein
MLTTTPKYTRKFQNSDAQKFKTLKINILTRRKSANSALVREQSPHRPMQEISLPPQNDAEYVKYVNILYGKPQTCDQKNTAPPIIGSAVMRK